MSDARRLHAGAIEMSEGRLTTHVLDIAAGRPAAGMAVELLQAASETPLVAVRTNADGRCERPLLEGDAMRAGLYELRFHVGDYYAAGSPTAERGSFLDVVPVRFRITDPAQHYHVPLLVAPYGYSTYRGS